MKAKDCVHFKECGACDFRLAFPKGQLKKKQEYVERLFKDNEVSPILAMDDPYFYRNKVLRTYRQRGKQGFLSGIYEKGSHWVVPIEQCLIEDEGAKAIQKSIHYLVKIRGIDIFDEDTGKGYLRHVLVRAAKATGQYSVTFVVRDKNFPKLDGFIKALRKKHPEVKSIYLNPHKRRTSIVIEGELIQVYGKGPIKDKLLGLDILLSGDSFYQVNWKQAKRLYELVMELLSPKEGEKILDAYCGIGIMALLAAKRGAKSIGVELNHSALQDALEMKKINKLSNVTFIEEDATKFMVDLANSGKTVDKVILDPPRTGTTKECIDALLTLSPERILYISCNPKQLKEELPLFEKKYKVGRIYPLDMFPFTRHVETVCLLSKLDVDQHIKVKLEMDELDLTASESKATYEEIKSYVKDKFDFKVSSLYVSQIKRKCGLEVGKNYNISKKENHPIPNCPPEKEDAIMDALYHFQMI